MEIGIALVLLLSISDVSIKMTNDRCDLFDKSWECIQRHLNSKNVPYQINILRFHIEKVHLKKCKI